MLNSISSAIVHGKQNGIQQGGVCYPIVSHCRTRMLLSSPIRDCVIVNENDLRLGLEVCGDRS
jgi:hypothetical protein